jgi:putative endonuclease
MWYLYILKCTDGSLYTGISDNVEKRFELHSQKKGAKYTKSHPPESIVHVELHDSKSSALKREIEVKKMSRSAKLRLIEKG